MDLTQGFGATEQQPLSQNTSEGPLGCRCALGGVTEHSSMKGYHPSFCSGCGALILNSRKHFTKEEENFIFLEVVCVCVSVRVCVCVCF